MEIEAADLIRLQMLADRITVPPETYTLQISSKDGVSHRPQSAKTRPNSCLGGEVEDEITNTRYLVAFDSELSDVYPSRSDSQTELIIQQLKETLSSSDTRPLPSLEDVVQTQGAFDTSVPENTLDEARRKQRKREWDKVALLGKEITIQKHIPTMSEIINEKAEEHYKRGLNHSENGRFEDSIIAFTKAINLQANNINLFIERAESFLQLCDFQSAIINYKRALSIEPHNPHLYEKLAFIYYLQGEVHFDAGLYTDALESFTHATDMRPGLQGYHIRAMACLAALGRNQECLVLLSRRIEAESTGNPELYVMRARLHEKCGNATLCYYDVREALALDPTQKQACEMIQNIERRSNELRNTAIKLTVENKLQEALNKISTAIDANPSVPKYHVLRGALHRRLNNFNAAIDDYLIAMDKADHNEKHEAYIDSQKQLLLTYNDFAVYCYQKGFFEEAVVLLNKAIKGEKMEKGLYINRGDCFFKQGDLAFALADYQQALELDESSWDSRCRIAVVHNELGISSYQTGLYQDAMQRFTAAIEQNPKVGQFYIHRARARYMIQDVDAARHDVLVSLHLDPDNDEVVPLASRLFPGKSIREVLQSTAAEAARKFIVNIIGSQTQLQPLPPQSAKSSRGKTRGTLKTRQSMMSSKSTNEKSESRITTASTESFVPRKMPNDTELIQEKKSVNSDLKNLFKVSCSISSKVPHLLTLVEPKPRQSKRKVAEADLHKPVYTWRNFGLGFLPD